MAISGKFALLTLLLFLSFCLTTGKAYEEKKSVYAVLDSDGRTPIVKYASEGSKPEVEGGLVGWASFHNAINSTGWSFLEVHTNGSYSDFIQALAAGQMEGVLTAELLHMFYQTSFADYCSADPDFCLTLGKFLGDNLEWMEAQIASNPDDKYWHQVYLMLSQFEGLKQGYRSDRTLPDIDDFGFLLMIVDGDLEDIEQALRKKDPRHVLGSGSCSALIKLLPGNKDLFISHVTWTTLLQMLRIFKLYDLPYKVSSNSGEVVPGRKQSFSSYPGYLDSGDDFYLLSSGMVSQETTIDNSNPDLWKYITAKGVVLEWIRVMLANRLASTTEEWTYLFSKYNSGTYNNQWMVLDYKLFTPGKQIKPGTLRILEQAPGIIETADMSVFLQEHYYWPSYNIPYFPYIYNMTGVMATYEKYGSWFSYELNPRGQIFKRDHGKVVDLESMMKLMRYNDFKHDPLSRCNCTPPYSGENAISARSDLNPADGKYPFPALGHRMHAATDAKVTTSELFKKFQCVAVSGPTHDQQPVFKWSTSGWKRPLGHPDAWDFEPVLVNWD